MRRMNLLLNGKRGTNSQSRKTFWCIVLASFAFHFGAQYVVNNHFHLKNPYDQNSNENGDDYFQEGDRNENAQSSSPLYFITAMIPFTFSFCLLYLIVMTRRYIRKKYRIPQTACTGVEDCCVAVCLPCCAISQMARHTTDYNLYRGAWCSETGLPSRVPSIV